MWRIYIYTYVYYRLKQCIYIYPCLCTTLSILLFRYSWVRIEVSCSGLHYIVCGINLYNNLSYNDGVWTPPQHKLFSASCFIILSYLQCDIYSLNIILQSNLLQQWTKTPEFGTILFYHCYINFTIYMVEVLCIFNMC